MGRAQIDDPNVGVVIVPDPRLEKIAEISHSKKITPTAIEFVDIAGLVKGASAGEGLGNQFLHHIREVEAIVQVVRCFENPDVHHVSATIDPVRDIEVINTELVLADLASLQKRRDRIQKQLHAGEKAANIESAIIEKLLPHLDRGKPAITAELTPEEKAVARGFFLLTSKPTIFACNVAESDLAAISKGDSANPSTRYVDLVQDYANHHFATEAIVVSAQIESELVDLSEQEAIEYLRGARRGRQRRARAHSRGVSSARVAHVFYHWRKGDPRVDHSRRRQSASRRRRDSLRF